MAERNGTWRWIVGILIGTVLGTVFTVGVWTATVRADITTNTNRISANKEGLKDVRSDCRTNTETRIKMEQDIAYIKKGVDELKAMLK